MKKIMLLFAVVAMTAALSACGGKQADAQQPEAQAAAVEGEKMTPEELMAYLEDCGRFYVATVDGDQARVRPFSFLLLHDGKVYFMTRKAKDVYKQLSVNNKVQVAAWKEKRDWMRITCKLVNDDNIEVKRAFLEKFPQLRNGHDENDPDLAMLYISSDATIVVGKKTYHL